MSPSPGGSRRFNRVFFLLALSLCLQCLLWRGRQRIEHSTDLRHHLDSPAATFALSDHHSGARISRRFFDDDPVSNTDGSGTLLNIDYSGLYESVSPSMRWLAFIALVLWAAFLFTTIGTSASEFFCPNLSSIADRLGLSESTAGVTFLAFGNGSPDVFSTFSALRSNTFSLAIGELLGAATFITTVVVGAMALVQPFHVPRWPFIRDVGFFSVAVMLMTSCLGDGKLTLVESGGMVVLYLFYVGIVVGGNWWSRRRRNRSASTSEDAAARRTGNVYQSLPNEDIHEDTPRSSEAQSQEGVHLDRLAPSRATTTTRSLRRQRSDLPSQQAQTPSSPSSVASPELLSHSTPNLEAGATPRVSPRLRASRRPVVDAPRPTFSLLGAIEFRDALNALRRESQAGDGGGGGGAGNGGHLTVATGDDLDRISPGLDDADVAEYFGAVSPFPGGHSHHHPHIRSVSGRSVGGGRRRSLSRPISYQGTIHESPAPTALTESDRRKTVAVGEVPLSVQASTTGHDDVTESGGLGPPRLEAAQLAPEPLLNNGSKADRVLGVDRRTTPLPKLVIPDTDTDTASAKDKEYSISEDSQPVRILRGTLHMLFPSLHHFRHKSISGQIFGVFAAPALLLLTLTLPVVDDTAEGYSVNKGGVQLSMSDADDDGDVAADDTLSEAEYDEQDTRATGQAAAHLHSLIIEPSHEDRDDRESQASDARILLFNKYLTAAQCVLSPLFISSVLFSDHSWAIYAIPAIGAAGLVAAAMVLWRARDGSNPYWRMVRCMCGFFSAMIWIAVIADEVVEVLKTFGHILGLSNALIGLTIFAVGNSLADLIANLTIASFAPSMSYAACFGGPMLNLLLGVGGAGTTTILKTGQPYVVHFSPTLWVSAIGLVTLLAITLIFVPLNGFYISRRWACFLIVYYSVLTILNVLVETRHWGRKK